MKTSRHDESPMLAERLEERSTLAILRRVRYAKVQEKFRFGLQMPIPGALTSLCRPRIAMESAIGISVGKIGREVWREKVVWTNKCLISRKRIHEEVRACEGMKTIDMVMVYKLSAT